jgi:hypothetical protein
VVNITPRPLYPRGKNLRYPLDKRLNGPQSLDDMEKRKLLETVDALHFHLSAQLSQFLTIIPGCKNNFLFHNFK